MRRKEPKKTSSLNLTLLLILISFVAIVIWMVLGVDSIPLCKEDRDCTSPYRCIDQECQIECEYNSQCRHPEICTQNQCIQPSCQSKDDCQDAFYSCVNYQCIPHDECTDSNDCKLDQICKVKVKGKKRCKGIDLLSGDTPGDPRCKRACLALLEKDESEYNHVDRELKEYVDRAFNYCNNTLHTNSIDEKKTQCYKQSMINCELWCHQEEYFK